MKKYGILLVVFLTTVVLAGSALAGKDNDGPRRRRGTDGPGRHWDKDGPGHHSGPGRSDCLKRLDLSEEKQAEIDSLRTAAREAAKDAETREQRREIYERMQEAIKAELTEDQLAELEKCRERGKGRGKGPRHGDCLKKLDLTEEQQAAIDGIKQRARNAAKDAESRQQRREIYERAHEAMKGELTEDQRAELERCRQRDRGRNRPGHRLGCMEELDLTADQQAAIDRIRDRAMNAARDAETREARREIFERMHEAIKAELTEDQRAELEECKARFGERISAREGAGAGGDQKGDGRKVRSRRGR